MTLLMVNYAWKRSVVGHLSFFNSYFFFFFQMFMQKYSFRLEPISKLIFFVIRSFFVIPVQTGIQFFRAFLDTRLRGYDSLVNA